MLQTTMGQLLVNEALPQELRDYNRTFDKKQLSAFLKMVAEKYPDKYVEITKKLNDIGREVATRTGGNSVAPKHIVKTVLARKYEQQLRKKIYQYLDDDELDDEERNEKIIEETGKVLEKIPEEVFQESLQEENPLAFQIVSGTRGNKVNLAELRGTGLLFTDHRDNLIPIPIISSYTEGLKPVEYWAGTYGARRGVLATKIATQEAGFLSKQLNQVSHRLIVVDEEDETDDGTPRGLPVSVDDADSEGALLAQDFGPYKRNTVVTPKILQDLKERGFDTILVRSPIVSNSPEGGVYARDVGIREYGGLPGRGEAVGLIAAQALSEPISQGQLSAKHAGGVAGADKVVGGFKYIDQLVQVPKTFKDGATVSTLDGIVSAIEPAPAGGHFVYIDGNRHYVPYGRELKVKKGDKLEAGDPLSDGIINPAEAVKYKGLGEGRRAFVNSFAEMMRNSNMKAHRRNIEILARGLINHGRLKEPWNDYLPDEVLPYSTVEKIYQPREGAVTGEPKKLLGMYLEKPVLHYSVGTKIRPSVAQMLEKFKVNNVVAHKDEPPFEPEMIRGMYSLQYDPDWITRMYGSGLKKSLIDAVHRGATSTELGTSFVPGLARAVEFGDVGLIRRPEPPIPPPPEGQPFPEKKKLADPFAPKAASAKYVPLSALVDSLLEKFAEGDNSLSSNLKPKSTESNPSSTSKKWIADPWKNHIAQQQSRQPTGIGKNPNATKLWGGYSPGSGPYHVGWSPEQMAAFTAGGINYMQNIDTPRQADALASRPDNFFGALTRFGTLFDDNAVRTLTSGNAYILPQRNIQNFPDNQMQQSQLQQMGQLLPPVYGPGNNVGLNYLFDPFSGNYSGSSFSSPQNRQTVGPYEENMLPRTGALIAGYTAGNRALTNYAMRHGPAVFGQNAAKAESLVHKEIQQALARQQASQAAKVPVQTAATSVPSGTAATEAAAQQAARAATTETAAAQQAAKATVPQAATQTAARGSTATEAKKMLQVAESVPGAEALSQQARNQAARKATSSAFTQSVPWLLRGAVQTTGGLVATPVNVALDAIEHTTGFPSWLGGSGKPVPLYGEHYTKATTPDGYFMGEVKDPTGKYNVLSSLGAAFNAWSRPIATWSDALGEIGRSLYDTGAATGLYSAKDNKSTVGKTTQELRREQELNRRHALELSKTMHTGVGSSGQRRPYANLQDLRHPEHRTNSWQDNLYRLNPYSAITGGIEDYRERSRLREIAKAERQFQLQEEQNRTERMRHTVEKLRPVRDRWLRAGAPAVWTDPLTNIPYGRGQEIDYQNWNKELNMTEQQRIDRDKTFYEKFVEDLATRDIASFGDIVRGQFKLPGF